MCISYMAYHISYYVYVSHVTFFVCLFSTLQPDILLHVDFDFALSSPFLYFSLSVTAENFEKKHRKSFDNLANKSPQHQRKVFE